MEVVRLSFWAMLVAFRIIGAGLFIFVGILHWEFGSLAWGAMELHTASFAIWNEFSKVKTDRSPDAILVPMFYLGTAFCLPIGASSLVGQVGLGLVAFLIWGCVCTLGRGFTAGGSTWCNLVDRGPYQFLRHPILALGLVGRLIVVLDRPAAVNLVGFAAALICTISVVVCEENFLRQQEEYQAYSERVRYRLVPFIW